MPLLGNNAARPNRKDRSKQVWEDDGGVATAPGIVLDVVQWIMWSPVINPHVVGRTKEERKIEESVKYGKNNQNGS